MKVSLRSLTRTERGRLLKALRAEGVKTPRVGFCVRALGGEVCRHPPYRHDKKDSGYQVIEIGFDPRAKRR